MADDEGELPRDAKRVLVDAFSTFGKEVLRDVWLFDQTDHEALYLRDDVEQKVGDLDVPVFVDNERYGYVTRDTYAELYYTSYEYTVRGFADFEQFRTFLANDDAKVGVFASFDRRDGGYDYAELHATVSGVVEDYHIEAFEPN